MVGIRELERLCIDDPREAIRLAGEQMADAPSNQLPLLYGVCGSAYRRMADLESAFFVLHEGIALAHLRQDTDTEARLLQRSAHIYGDRGKFIQALRATEVATLKFISVGNFRGASRALLDQGQWNYYLGRLEKSIVVCRAAFRALPVDEIANRFACLQGIGLCYLELEQPRRAIRYAQLAHRFEGTISRPLWSKQLWLEARILRQLGHFEEAEDLLSEVVGYFLDTEAHLDVALACTEMARLALKAGGVERARRIAESFGKLLLANQRLARNEIASAALMDLARSAATEKRLRKAIASIKRRLERVRPHPRLVGL